MNDKKVALYFFGYSCSGKSSVETLIREKLTGLYTVDYDVQKKQLSGYYRNEDREKIRKIVRGLFEVVCKSGFPALLTSLPIESEAEYLTYAKVAKENGYELLSFEFTATREILILRYRERLEQYKSVGEGDSLKSEDEFLETLNNPPFIPKDAVTFDTSDTSPEDIAQKLLEIVVKHIS